MDDGSAFQQKDFGIGTVHNTLADEGQDDDGTTTGASGQEFNEVKNIQMNKIRLSAWCMESVAV